MLYDYLFRFSKVLSRTQQAALDTLPLGVVILDQSKRLFYANQAFRRFFQGSRLISQADKNSFWVIEALKRIGKKNRVRGLFPITEIPKEIRFKGRVLEEVFYHLPPKDGVPESYVGIFEDVTEKKKIQASLQEARRLSSLSQLLGGLAHEFSNPLAIIQTQMEILRPRVSRADREDLDVVDRQLKRLKRTVESLSVTLRASSLPAEPVSLKETVHQIADSLREDLALAHIRLEIEATEGLPPIWIHPEKIRQLVLQLVLNAKAAIERTKKNGRIEIGLRKGPGRFLTLTCRDNGAGIPRQIQGQIFEPFFSTRKSGAGMGLGLTLVRTIVHELGGTIALKSRPGFGTTFTLRLPLGKEIDNGQR